MTYKRTDKDSREGSPALSKPVFLWGRLVYRFMGGLNKKNIEFNDNNCDTTTTTNNYDDDNNNNTSTTTTTTTTNNNNNNNNSNNNNN